MLNRILVNYYEDPEEVYRQWGVESYDKILKKHIIERLAHAEIVTGVTKVINGIKNAILIKQVDGEKIKAINQFGGVVEYEYDQVEDGLVSLKLSNNKFMF